MGIAIIIRPRQLVVSKVLHPSHHRQVVGVRQRPKQEHNVKGMLKQEVDIVGSINKVCCYF